MEPQWAGEPNDLKTEALCPRLARRVEGRGGGGGGRYPLGQPPLRNLIDACKGKRNLAILDLSANGILGPEGNRMPSMAHLCKGVLPTLHLMHLCLAYNELQARHPHCAYLRTDPSTDLL